MTHIKGFFINLEESKERRRRMEDHSSSIKLGHKYERFNAQRSTKEEANKRGLTQGELGLWKSWIKLLEHAISQTKTEHFTYLHIMEDDTILNKHIHRQLIGIDKNFQDAHIILTDMYTNEEIWRKSTNVVDDLKEKEEIAFTKTYTGCLSSAIIPASHISHIYSILSCKVNAGDKLLPLDNAVRELQSSGKINILCTLPFLSTIDITSVISSDIQEYDSSNTEIGLTQKLNALLRKQLSVLSTKNTTKDIVETLEMLAEACDEKSISQSIIKEALRLGKEKDLFRYKLQPRLKGQPGNNQDQILGTKLNRNSH